MNTKVAHRDGAGNDVKKRRLDNRAPTTWEEQQFVYDKIVKLDDGDIGGSGKYATLAAFAEPVVKPLRSIIGREEERDQVLAALHRPELSNVLLLAPAGSGKALTDDTPIATADGRGYVPIGKLSVGDVVYSADGRPTTVIGVYPQGSKRVYRVHFTDGTWVDCCREHLWNVRTAVDRGAGADYTTMSLGEMLDAQMGRSPLLYSTPVAGAVQWPTAHLPLDPWAVGYLAAAGQVGVARQPVVVTGSKDLVEEVAPKLADAFDATADIRSTSGRHRVLFSVDDGDDRTWVTSESVAQIDESLSSVFGRIIGLRTVPEAYMTASVEQRTQLLHGLMDAGGRVLDRPGRNPTVAFRSSSEQLAQQVRQLAASLGYRSRIRVISSDNHESWTVTLRVDVTRARSLFSLNYRLRPLGSEDEGRVSKLRRTRYLDDLIITSIEDLGVDAPMTCIRVDDESHLFQAGTAHIVTHNTALVQSTMLADGSRMYLEVNLPGMAVGAHGIHGMASAVKNLFREAEEFVKETGIKLVLFIDEFHLLVQLSPAAAEAIKPVLAASGQRGILIIAATTFDEYHEFLSSNEPLKQRLQTIRLTPADEETTVSILRRMADEAGVGEHFPDDSLLRTIYELTERYEPSSMQPRKSIRVLDAMIGWHRYGGERMSMDLLAKVLKQSIGVDIAFRVDGRSIKQRLDAAVYAQQLASQVLTRRLLLAVADLQDHSRPIASFLFTGATGTGKTQMVKEMARLLYGDDRGRLIRFDMSEYANRETLEAFQSSLTKQVSNYGSAIILLDEIEKSNLEVLHLLYQVLDDGRLTDDYGRQVSFLNTYIVMTTNAGSEIYATIADFTSSSTGDGSELEDYIKNIEASVRKTADFPEALMGRIDEIVPFSPLSEETLAKIVIRRLAEIRDEVMRKHNIKMEVSPRVVNYVIEDKGSAQTKEGGARGALRVLTKEVTTKIAEFISENEGVAAIRVGVVGRMSSEHKTLRKTEASIEVVAI